MNSDKNKKMLTIAWDVDDVMNNLTEGWFQSFQMRQRTIGMSYSQLTENPPHQLLHINKTTYLESLDEYRMAAISAFEPRQSLYNWFSANGAQYRHVAITAAPRQFAGLQAEWVMKHFGDWIRSFHFTPSYRVTDAMPTYDTAKHQMISWLGNIDLLIDDSEHNIDSLQHSTTLGLLYPQPWNRHRNMSESEFIDLLNAQLQQREVNAVV